MKEDRLRRDALTQSSEATVHESTPYWRESHERRLRGYMPHPAERETRGEPRELFAMKNSYNDLAVGADKKGDLTVSGSAERRHDSPTLRNDAKRVEGARRKKHPTGTGELFTNPAKPAESAFAYRVSAKMPEKKILKKLREASRRHGTDAFAETMPFLKLPEKERQLQAMRREHAPETEIQHLSKVIRDESAMEMRFLRHLRLARKKLHSLEPDELLAELFGEKSPARIPTPLPSHPDSTDDDAEENENEEEEN